MDTQTQTFSTIQEDCIKESWESTTGVELSIDEGSSEVDGIYILAKISGPAFFPDSISKNNVYYPQESWELAIADDEFQRRLKDRLVYGTIGHDSELTDTDIREGKASHIVTRVWINEENIGMADYLVLATDAGRNLNTYVRAKSKLRVSTKADGMFKSTSQSSKTVVPTAFRFVRIDFVQSPGYMQALPTILESSENVLVEEPVHESLINQKLTGNTNMENDKVVTILESQISELKSEKAITIQQGAAIVEELQKVKTTIAVTEGIVESYKALGTISQIQESNAELAQYKSIGTVSQIHEALEDSSEAIDKLTETVATLTATVTNLTAQVEDANAGADAVVAASTIDPSAPVYAGGDELGTPDEINTVLDTVAANQEELGTPAEIRDALDMADSQRLELEQFRKLGTVEEIKNALNAAETVAESIEASQTSDLANEFSVDQSVVTNALDKGLSLGDVRDMLVSMRPAVKEDDTTAGTGDAPTPEASDTDTSASDPAPAADPDATDVSESYSSKLFGAIRNKHKINESAPTKQPRGSTPLVNRLFNSRR